MNSVNQVPAGETIFKERDKITGVALVVKGRVQIVNNGVKAFASTGTFLGICDLSMGSYQVSYQAVEDSVVYAFPVTTEEGIEKIFAYNKEYASLMALSLNRYVRDLAKGYEAFAKETKELCSHAITAYQSYQALSKKSGYRADEIEELKNLSEYESDLGEGEELVSYYNACNEVSMDVRKAFYRHPVICLHHILEQAHLAQELIRERMGQAVYILELLECMYADHDDCMFRGVMKLAFHLTDASMKSQSEKLVDSVIDQINRAESVLLEHSALELSIDRQYMESAYYKLISGEDMLGADLVLEAGHDVEEDMKEVFFNSLEQILDYSEIAGEKKEEFSEYIDAYVKLKDKSSTEDDARTLRRKIAKEYYGIYLAAFRKAYKDPECPKVVDLYLRYGFMDERLLSEEQLSDLYHLQPDLSEQEPCHVYSMYDWLKAIYEGEKEPSKSEMDMDYQEALREKKKNKEVTEEQARRLETDTEAKLAYEVQNMLTYNNRILSGQATTFVPVLHEESFIGSVRKAALAAPAINAAINRILSVDYSVFYRQAVYSDMEHGITKEYMMQEVFPDIILLPTCGSNGIMWQDISGRKRTTPGRFLLPAFCDGSLEDILIRLIGRFRWELCRTVQGVSWNDVKVKSLTSEYMDYIQFYKKNHELSEEKKEKLKVQIQKSRGNTREVFVVDYFAWVKFESQGSIRLNKTVRDILATYCPFSKELRVKVTSQPMFAEAFNRFQRETMKAIKENQTRRRGLEKAGVEVIPPELLKTYEFYEKM